ncbi:uncharacterized protein PV09_05983 [Verruconis gallopava]|uniref:Rhodopsin domain-containing protein n=1 Tax=Verruconis gallopava TaxID=253628 RepID=A0A0D1YQT2_9PEZI|nr:uncharacterized protein PV09_05983 [Verruconis gallopava]KIW02937.1 hypothetical protein PV09_05983 [Verruconis gallopava]
MAAKLFWAVAASFIRFALLALYYRLLSHIDILHRGMYKWVLHAATFFNIGILLSYLGTIIFDCADPAQYFQWPGTGYCINETYANVAMASLNTFAEALVAALPIPVVMSLDMDKRQRRTVMLLLCLGFLVSVVGTVRTYYVWKLFNSDDLTWYASPHWICSEVEICTAMICACAPALRSFVGRVFWREEPGIQTQSNSSRFRKNRSSAGSHDSKHATHVEEGWVPPTRYQYDLEGIGLDGFGYTVTISGPQHRKKGIASCFQGTPVASNDRIDQPPRRYLSKLGRKSRRSMQELREDSDTTELQDKSSMNNGTREVRGGILP